MEEELLTAGLKAVKENYGDQIKELFGQEVIVPTTPFPVVKLADLYNDSFNGFVNFDHSDSDLQLDGISGRIVPFGYQCSGIRRASEDGRGVARVNHDGVGTCAQQPDIVIAKRGKRDNLHP